MKHCFALAIVLAVSVVTCSVGSAQPVGSALETLTVPATGATATSSTALTAGEWYWILAEGTYVQSYAGHLADPEWEQLVAGSGDPADWRESNPEMPSEHELLIDETDVDWMGNDTETSPDPLLDWADYDVHTFSQDHHTYWYRIQGTGSALDFRIEEHEYVDNSGQLAVSLYHEVPEPTVLALLAPGLLLFLRKRKK